VAGSELKLECKFSGSPQPEVEWFKDGGPLEESDRVTCTVSDDATSLVIKKTEADDEGWYRCRISNEKGATAVEAELIVVEVPTFVTGLEDVTIDEGMKSPNLLVKKWLGNNVSCPPSENMAGKQCFMTFPL
jgi:hypothetical protein